MAVSRVCRPRRYSTFGVRRFSAAFVFLRPKNKSGGKAPLSKVSNAACVQYGGLGAAGGEQHEAAARSVDLDDAAGLALGGTVEDRLHRLYDGDDVAVGARVVIRQRSHLCQTFAAQSRGAAEFDVGDLLEEAADDLDAVAALRALAPGFQEASVIVMEIGRAHV